MKSVRKIIATVLIMVLLGASVGSYAAVVTIENSGFESDGAGWISLNTTFEASKSYSTTTVSANGSKMAVLTAGGGNQGTTNLQGALGFNNNAKTYIDTYYSGMTDYSYIYKDVALNAGDTFTMSWNYIATDDISYNDASLAFLINTDSGGLNGRLDGYYSQVSILGATTAHTANYTTNGQGSTGWQSISYEILESGTYKIAFVSFNLDDTINSPHLCVDIASGLTKVNSVEVDPLDKDTDPPTPPGPYIGYSSDIFTEDGADDGSIATSITLTLQDDTFSGSNGQEVDYVSVSNLPVGLSSKIVKTSDTVLTMTIEGNATSHYDENDVNNLTVTFTDDAFTNYLATVVANSIKSDLNIDFTGTAPAEVTLSYDGNGNTGGSVPSSPMNVTPSSSITLAQNTGNLEKSGYSFNGWNTVANGSGTAYAGGGSLTVPSSDLTLYAQWTANSNVLSYNANGGTGSMSDESHNSDSSLTLTLNTFTRTGYSFNGWSTLDDGTGDSYADGVSFTMSTSDETLYAQWTANSNTLSYDANSGTGNMSNELHVTDASLDLTTNAFTKAGYTFIGWNTAADGSGDSYVDGASFKMPTMDETLYAQWTPSNYTLSYAPVHDVTSPAAVSVAYGTLLEKPTDPENPGYTLLGWFYDAAFSNEVDFTVDTMPSSNLTLYAQWTENAYTLTFNDGYSTTTQSAIQVIYGNVLQEPDEPERSGYTFEGWFNDAELTSAVNFASDTMPASDKTVYAGWMLNAYTLSFDDGYDVTTPSSIQVTYGNALYEPQDPAHAGYTFSGWYYDQALTHSVSFATDTMPASNLTLYAKWGVNPYTITYSAGVDVTSPSAAMADYLTQIPEPTEPQREGYNFDGWYYDSAYADVVDFDGDTMPAHDLILYAKWQINQYTVTLNYGYETTSGSAINVTYGDKVNPGTPVRSGYDFGAWYRDSVFSLLWDVVSDTMPATDMTLYAKWTMVIGADLEDLDVQTYGLNETFSASRTSYTVSDVVDSQIDIRAYASPDQYSTVTVNAQAVDADGWITVNLENGENIFDILVTAQDGVTTKTYTLVIYKLYDEAVLSNVTATGGNGVRGFDSGVRSYDMGSTKLSQITISATAFSDVPVSKIEIAGVTVASGVSQTVNLLYGINVIAVDVVAEDGVTTGTYELTIQRLKAGSGSSSSSSGATTDTTPTERDERTNTVTVIVNGQPKSAGTEKITESVDRKSAEITVVRDVIEAEIKAVITQTATAENIIQVPISESDVDNVKVGLTGDIIKLMEDNVFDLSIESGDAEYIIPAKEFEIVNVARLLEVDENNLVDIEVNVSVEKVENAKIAEIQSKLGTTMKMLAAPVAFKVEATATNRSGVSKTVEVEKFSEFVKRRIDLPDMTDRTQITTAVIYNDDGSYSHIPTSVEVVDGGYKAVINSLTNSVYTVIWNSVEFEDMTNHWAKDAVNDLGSRLVVSGKGENAFKPDDRVTRAEFSAMVVQGLGILRPDQESSTFEDISGSDWYQDAVSSANAYGLISGYPDNTFKPLENIKREEAFAVAYNAMKIAGYVPVEVAASDILSAFADQNEVAGWAQNATAGLVECGVVSGFDGQINPEGLLTRAEAAVLIRSILTYNGLIN